MAVYFLLYLLGIPELPWYVQLPTLAFSTVITYMLND